MSDNLKIWNAVKQVPPSFLKPIGFGKLKGKSDINPQWRIMAMTQAFGVVGHGLGLPHCQDLERERTRWQRYVLC